MRAQLHQQREILAEWDPLQAGYQAIVDICDEARSKIESWECQKDFYDPERASAANQKMYTDKIIEHQNSSIGMPPPQRFNRRSRNPFPG